MLRKGRRIAIFVTAAVAWVLSTGPVGRAAPSDADGVLVIETVPELDGVRFSLDGRTFESDKKGKARVVSSSGEHVLKLLDEELRGPGMTATFAIWKDDRTLTADRPVTVRSGPVTRLQVGFNVSYQVSLVFVDQYGAVVDPGQIESVTFSNKLGDRLPLAPTAQPWIRGSYIRRVGDGLVPVLIPHSVQSVVVDGSEVVNRGQQQFLGSQNWRWRIELLFYTARFVVRDRLFGFPIGRSITLEYPDGHTELHPLGPGAELAIRRLPRGNYRITVHGPGILVAAPVALSKDQEARLVFLSYYDITAAVVLALCFLVGLVVIGRRRHAGELGSPPVRRAPRDKAGTERVEVGLWPR